MNSKNSKNSNNEEQEANDAKVISQTIESGGLQLVDRKDNRHFLHVISVLQKRAFLRAKPAKSFRMADPDFRLFVSVYEINEIIHGHLKIWNLSSRVEERRSNWTR